MYRIHLIAAILLSSHSTFSQNIGVGTINPQQKLEVDGAVKIGNTDTNHPGTIRYNSGKFEGGDGSQWKSLEGFPSKAIILARSRDTADFIANGYKVFGISDVDDTINYSLSENYPGQWNYIPDTVDVNAPSFPYNYECIEYANQLVYYNPITGDLHSYQPSTNSWSILTLNQSGLSFRLSYSLTLVNNEIFVLGGWNLNSGLRTVLNDGAKYNLSTGTWTPVTMPKPFAYHASCSFNNNQLWIFGGCETINPDPGSPMLIQLTRRTFKYDVGTGTWTSNLATVNTPFISTANAHEYGGNIILVNTDSVTTFNTSSNDYIRLIDMPESTNYFTASTRKGSDIYLIGQFDVFFSPSQSIRFMRQYKINLSGGSVTRLNTCAFLFSYNEFSFNYIYSSAANKFYFGLKNSYDALHFIDFTEAGSSSCTRENSFNTKLYYMQKL